MKICGNHEKQVPLISTYAFNGAEFWCPYCGYTGGFLGAGVKVETTKELVDLHTHYVELSKGFLHAKSVGICSSTLFNGERMDPRDLPDEEKARLAKVIKDWVYDCKEDEEREEGSEGGLL